MADAIGTVTAIWRYPVKSMLGEQLQEAEIGPGGIPGDRAYALIDRETGKLVSAKQPKKWGRLFHIRAETAADGAMRVVLPGGATYPVGDPATDRALSDALEREVTLQARLPEGAQYEVVRPDIAELGGPAEYDSRPGYAAPGTFFDFGPIHLLSEGALAAMRASEPGVDFDVRRFRPNVLVAVDSPERFPENGWVGRQLQLGESVRVQGALAAPRCVMTTLEQQGLPAEPRALRAIARENLLDFGQARKMACLGLYAGVAAPGRIRAGDPVYLFPAVG